VDYDAIVFPAVNVVCKRPMVRGVAENQLFDFEIFGAGSVCLSFQLLL
jgi:hypothetical protein